MKLDVKQALDPAEPDLLESWFFFLSLLRAYALK